MERGAYVEGAGGVALAGEDRRGGNWRRRSAGREQDAEERDGCSGSRFNCFGEEVGDEEAQLLDLLAVPRRRRRCGAMVRWLWWNYFGEKNRGWRRGGRRRRDGRRGLGFGRGSRAG